jgi:hypothetical protein
MIWHAWHQSKLAIYNSMIRHTWVVEDRKCPDLIDVEWVELHVNDPNLAIFSDSMIGFAPAGVKWRISDP